MNLKQYWQESIGGIPFNNENVETDTEWGWQKEGGILYLNFCGSGSKLDWIQNFSFWKVPYKDMPVKWRAHAGFVKKWKSIRKQLWTLIDALVIGNGVTQIEIRGYSQGAAIALLAHEDIWFNYEVKVNTVVFGCPRVIAFPPIDVSERFEKVTRVTNGGDIVTGLPPWWMGYKHVGEEIRIGKKRLRIWIEDHLIKNYTMSLEE